MTQFLKPLLNTEHSPGTKKNHIQYCHNTRIGFAVYDCILSPHMAKQHPCLAVLSGYNLP